MRSDCGRQWSLFFFYTTPSSDELTPVAHYGLSPAIRDKVGSYLKQKDSF